MAGAHKLVLRLVPRDDAPEMGAHGVERIVLEVGLIVVDNEIGGISAEALDKLPRASIMAREVISLFDTIAEGVLRNDSAASTARGLGHEEIRERVQRTKRDRRGSTGKEQVHGIALGHVGDHVPGVAGGGHGGAAGGARGRRGDCCACKSGAREDRRARDESHGELGEGDVVAVVAGGSKVIWHAGTVRSVAEHKRFAILSDVGELTRG